MTPECLGEAMYREVMLADEYKLRKLPAADYDKRAADADDEQKKAIIADYPDTHVKINGEDYVVPNPYRARAVRQGYRGSPVSFANPAGSTSYNSAVRKANAALINKLSFDDVLLDSDMTRAFLSSLWFCATNPILDGERCTPAAAIAKLREFEKYKYQAAIGAKADAMTANGTWGSIKAQLDTVLGYFAPTSIPVGPPATVTPPIGSPRPIVAPPIGVRRPIVTPIVVPTKGMPVVIPIGGNPRLVTIKRGFAAGPPLKPTRGFGFIVPKA